MYEIGREHYAYRKNIEDTILDNSKLENIEIDFEIIDDRGVIQGLLGLDVLMKFDISLDLENLRLKISDDIRRSRENIG